MSIQSSLSPDCFTRLAMRLTSLQKNAAVASGEGFCSSQALSPCARLLVDHLVRAGHAGALA